MFDIAVTVKPNSIQFVNCFKLKFSMDFLKTEIRSCIIKTVNFFFLPFLTGFYLKYPNNFLDVNFKKLLVNSRLVLEIMPFITINSNNYTLRIKHLLYIIHRSVLYSITYDRLWSKGQPCFLSFGFRRLWV